MMKKLGGKGGASAMKALLGGGKPLGGMGGGKMPDLGALAKGLGGKMPGGLSGGLSGGLPGGSPGGLPGLGGKPPEDKK